MSSQAWVLHELGRKNDKNKQLGDSPKKYKNSSLQKQVLTGFELQAFAISSSCVDYTPLRSKPVALSLLQLRLMDDCIWLYSAEAKQSSHHLWDHINLANRQLEKSHERKETEKNWLLRKISTFKEKYTALILFEFQKQTMIQFSLQ